MKTGSTSGKSLPRLKVLISAAVIFSGFLAGATVDRFVVQFPAFRHLDIINWAAYSRHADNGNGIILYPLLAGGGFLILLAACVTVFRNNTFFNPVAKPIYLAAALSAAGLAFTIFAAPVMLGVRNMGNDTVLLQYAFDRFYFWSSFRAIVQVASFFCAIWALASVHGKLQ